jgi:hypothetical protein
MSPVNGHSQDTRACLKGENSGTRHCNDNHSDSPARLIASSYRARSSCPKGPTTSFRFETRRVGLSTEPVLPVPPPLVRQAYKLDVALALPLQAPARLHPIDVSVDVNLQQRRPDDRPAFLSPSGSTPPKPSPTRSSSSTKTSIARTGILRQIVFQPLWKQSALTAVFANEAPPGPGLGLVTSLCTGDEMRGPLNQYSARRRFSFERLPNLFCWQADRHGI